MPTRTFIDSGVLIAAATGDDELSAAAMAVLDGSSGGADVPGGRVELRRGRLVLTPQKPAPK